MLLYLRLLPVEGTTASIYMCISPSRGSRVPKAGISLFTVVSLADGRRLGPENSQQVFVIAYY